MEEERFEERREEESTFELMQYRSIRFLLSDKGVPKKIRNFFWAFINKELAVTNIKDESDVRRIKRKYRDAVLAFLMSQPDCSFDFLHEFLLSQGETFVEAKARRSIGALERRMIATQIREYRSTYEEITPKGGGFVGRIKRFFGLR